MIKKKYTVEGSDGRLMPVDLVYDDSSKNPPVILFCHGFKGFKDWGAWSLMGSAFAKAGYAFISFNYSHNGGTVENPIDFPDLEAFGNNNYSKEVADTISMLDWIEQLDAPIDKNRNILMGHSRAGGIATLVTAHDPRVKAVITLAAVADYGERFPNDLESWKKDGVFCIKNGRTNQDMPLYFQFYEDWLKNQNDLEILKAARGITVPHIILHGSADSTVTVENAARLHEANPASELRIITGADHVFGSSHPWNENYLPAHLNQVVQCSVNWLQDSVVKSAH